MHAFVSAFVTDSQFFRLIHYMVSKTAAEKREVEEVSPQQNGTGDQLEHLQQRGEKEKPSARRNSVLLLADQDSVEGGQEDSLDCQAAAAAGSETGSAMSQVNFKRRVAKIYKMCVLK